MTVIDIIRKHISELPIDALFTTRDLLNYGTRNAVDKATCSLVKDGEIIREAWGVFRSPLRTKPVGIFEIATVKAQSFGRTIISHALDAAIDMGLLAESDPNGQIYFATNGRTSSFRFCMLTINFKGTSPRMVALGDTKVGRVIRALRHLGRRRATEEMIEKAINWLSISEREEAGSLCSFMPLWLSSFFCDFYRNRLILPPIETLDLDFNKLPDGSSTLIQELNNSYVLHPYQFAST